LVEHFELVADAHPAGERLAVRLEAPSEPVAERRTLKHNAAGSEAPWRRRTRPTSPHQDWPSPERVRIAVAARLVAGRAAGTTEKSSPGPPWAIRQHRNAHNKPGVTAALDDEERSAAAAKLPWRLTKLTVPEPYEPLAAALERAHHCAVPIVALNGRELTCPEFVRGVEADREHFSRQAREDGAHLKAIREAAMAQGYGTYSDFLTGMHALRKRLLGEARMGVGEAETQLQAELDYLVRKTFAKYIDEANWYWAVGRFSALHGAP
jgi:hypothetical protein